MYSVEMSELIGKVFNEVYAENDAIYFKNDAETYVLQHDQECCENVTIDDICGDLHNLEGAEITFSDRSTNSDNPKKNDDDYSFTWTFFKFATIKGWVDIRFYGTSNGYYSEDADLYKYE